MQQIFRIKVPMHKIIDGVKSKVPLPMGKEVRVDDIRFDKVDWNITIDFEILNIQPKDKP